MARADAGRRRLTVDAAELGALGALGGDALAPLRGRAETALALRALEEAGVVERGAAVPWAAPIAGTVARPLLRAAVEAFLGPGRIVPHRVWLGEDGAVLGREVGGRFELAWVEHAQVVPALLHALDVPSAVPRVPGGEVVVAAGELPAARRWAWRASVPGQEPLIVVDGGEGGLWTCRPVGDGLFAVTPVSREEVARRLAALLVGGGPDEGP